MKLPYKYRKLDMKIDSHIILSEIESVGGDLWSTHCFHSTSHDIISLISTGGTLQNPDGSANNALIPPFLPTEHLDKLPYTKEVIYSFGTPPHRTRFTLMHPGSTITPHRDLQPNWFNKVRVHIPIQTHPDVRFHIWEEEERLAPEDRTDMHFSANGAWVFDTWRVHAVTNFSDVPRIHLIVDLEPRGDLYSLMFDGIDREEIDQTLSYQYPSTYTTDRETLEWLTAKQPDIGVALWNTVVVDKNPQVGRYKHAEDFWNS
jgi:hypothetical protein